MNGYEWRQKGTSKDGFTQFWACNEKDCPGRAHSPIGTNDLNLVTAHKHKPRPNLQIVRFLVCILSIKNEK